MIKQALYYLTICLCCGACHLNKADHTGNTSAYTDSTPASVSTTMSEQPVRILLPAQYRKQSGYPQKIKDKQWYELYKDERSGKWMVAKADLTISYGHDECVDDEVMLIHSKHEEALMFFTTFPGMAENPVTVVEDKAIFPEHTLDFEFNGKEYTLSPIGNVYDNEAHVIPSDVVARHADEILSDTRITAYLLSFTAPGGIDYDIASIDEMQSVTPKVMWAGDINGDGLPDLVLDLRDFYESQHVFLFLSDVNSKTKPLKKAADLKVVNDC